MPKNIRQDVVKRIAARLLRANTAEVIALTPKQRPDCVTALITDFVTPGTRTEIVRTWHEHLPAITLAGWLDPHPRETLDRAISELRG